ncbi:MAG: hypothetical protein ACXVGN_13170, partial [Mycobacteriaceae bacterium]
TAISLLAYAFLAVAAAFQRTRDEDAGILGLIPVTIPELLRQLRGTVIPEPRRDRATATAGRYGAAATSTAPGKLTSAGRPTPMRCPNNDLQLPYQMHPWTPDRGAAFPGHKPTEQGSPEP